MIGVVCGTRLEAAILTDLGLRQLISIAISGASPDRAEARARDLVAAGVTFLLSAGVAGGLNPALKSGDLVIAEAVLSANAERQASHVGDGWLSNLSRQHLRQVTVGKVLGVDEPIIDRREKSDLYHCTQAGVVDMESHRVALVAEEHGLPFAVVRAVADPAHLSLPLSAFAGLDCQGREHVWPVLRSLLRRPSDTPGLIQLAFHYKRALKSLARFARAADEIPQAVQVHKEGNG